MPGQRGRLSTDALRQVTITDQRVRGMVDHIESGPVVPGRQLRLGDRHADRVRDALPERSRGDLDAARVTAFGMPGLFTPIYSDENHRMFYKRWAEFMEAKDWDELQAHEPVK